MDENICALATPMGSGGIAVIRISGNSILEKIRYLFVKDVQRIERNTVHYLKIFDLKKQLIDDIVLTYFKSPNSYTGEDVIEISCHCNRLIIEQILVVLNQIGIRLAEAGEFTKRAFLNGKVDLIQAEAVSDLILANNTFAIKNSRNILDGKLSRIIAEMREQMMKIAGLLEIDLDFSEEDLDLVDLQKVIKKIDQSINTINSFIKQSNSMRFIHEGIKLSIVGRPNAGKSSLLNALIGRDRAIVSDIEGTTRDTVEETILLDGIAVRLIDTAGIRKSEDQIEKIGVEYSYRSIEQSDCVIIVIDSVKGIIDEDESIIDKCKSDGKKYIIVFNKSDLKEIETEFENSISISVKTEFNLELLKEKIKSLYQIDQLEANDDLVISNLRHEVALSNVVKHLNQAKAAITNKAGNEIISFDIRQALDELAIVSGEITSEDVLNDIFENFCIGK